MIEANMMRFVHLVSFLILLCSHLQHNMAAVTDTILPGQQISYTETIISAGDVFEMGFFTPGNSTNYYVGIWYKKVPKQTVVWVANRDYPVSSTSGVLTINTDGNLVISDRQFFYMVTNTTSKGNTSATLLDSGNLILKDLNSVVSWQSFDNPTHVFLPGMKLGINKRTGRASSLVSWKSTDDPGSGAFSLKMDEQNSQLIRMQGTQIYWASGLWDGKRFSKVPEMLLNYIVYNFSYTSNENESYYTYSLYNASIISIVVMDVSGLIKQLTWLESSQQWNLFSSNQNYQCDVPAICGSFGVCNEETYPSCQCLFGFEPHSSEAWRQQDRSGGCTRKVPLQCENTIAINGEEDKFLMMSNMIIPATGQQFVVGSSKECTFSCLSNCSCSAYAYNGSGGCSIWIGGLFNLQQLQAEDKYGKTIYVKLAASELPGSGGNKKLLFLIIPVVASLLLGCYFSCQWRRNKRKQKGNVEPGQNILLFDMGLSSSTTNNELSSNKAVGSGKSNDSGLPLFTFASVSAATDDFSAKNKLGEGGFGPVYKGKLLKGHEIAVKRLSKKSGQGLEELKNEAVLIAKLQHRNLVRLLGCCLEQEEKILIYEYMPNKSLDTFLFDPAKRGLLDWGTRVCIVEGIAQGLLYLHQYSRLKIIHRDLKASNILLDADMNPKISDFGMARIFGGNETQANTKHIAGTYGYMAPEYALQGIFSEKSDVFSFGVLLLEIVSGKKNTGFYQSDSLNLLGYAWDLWKDDRALDLMDLVWEDELSTNILLRYIHVALLCVQEIAAYRPIMSEVVSMLTNEVTVLPSPEQPAFSDLRSLKTLNAPMSRPEICSKNEVTVSLLEAR